MELPGCLKAAVCIAIEHLLFWVSEGGKGVNCSAELTGDHNSSFIVNLFCDFHRRSPGWSSSAAVWEQTDLFEETRGGLSVFCFITILHNKFALFIRVFTQIR